MKTTLTLLILLLIASGAFSQSATQNSVCFDSLTANRIRHELIDYDLLQVEHARLQEAMQQQQIKVTALHMQLTQERIKVNLQVDYSAKVERQLKKQKLQGTLSKIAVPLAFVLGVVVGK